MPIFSLSMAAEPGGRPTVKFQPISRRRAMKSALALELESTVRAPSHCFHQKV